MRVCQEKGVNASELKKGVNEATHPDHQFLASAPPPGRRGLSPSTFSTPSEQ